MTAPLILASSSPYRRQLLERLGLAFTVIPPRIDETPLPEETPADLAARLARTKAHAIARTRRDALVIGSDQVTELNGEPLGKPGDYAGTIAQLERLSGHRVRFHTGLCLMADGGAREQLDVVLAEVEFRRLARSQIERYVHREQPYDCAGGFRAEGLGIALFERLLGDDPTALIGLPLIRLCRMLERAGIEVL